VTRPPALQGPEPTELRRAELRRALLTAPAMAAGVAAIVVAVVSAALDGHHVAAAVSALVAAAVVIAASGVTGVLGVRSAAARPEAVFAAAMVSFMTKVLVFAVALAVIGSVDSARRVPFAIGAITAVLVWLTVEVVGVARLRSTGAAVFGPPITAGPASETTPGTTPETTPDTAFRDAADRGLGSATGHLDIPAPGPSVPVPQVGRTPPVG